MKTAIVFILLCGVMYLFQHMTLQPTPSMQHSLYLISNSKPVKGDRVNFDFNHPLVMENKKVKFLKKLSCVEGDTLAIGNDMFFCNDILIGVGAPIKIKGNTVDTFKYEGVIPKGKAFVLGESGNSFDSRYWGFVEYKQLTRLIPII